MSKRIPGLLCVVFVLLASVQCNTVHVLQSIGVSPNSQVVLTGQKAQFRATGTYHGSNQSTYIKDISSQVTWASSNQSVATVDATGMATAVGAGTATITATTEASDNSVTGSATLISSGDAAHDLTAITIIPPTGKQTVSSKGETAQYIAIGTFNSAPGTVDITDQVTWQSSDVKVATINSAGLATANDCEPVGSACVTVITASLLSPGSAAIVGTSDLTVTNSPGSTELPSLAVYSVGEGAGTVVSTPVGLSCGSGADCTGHFPLGSTVVLTATPSAGSQFGGWSNNCQPSNALQCSIAMNDNEAVGAIFNLNP